MEHSESLRDSPAHRSDHQKLLTQLHLQHGKQQPELPSQDSRTSGEGCFMSAVLFNLVIDWMMRRTMEDQPRGIRWTLVDTLEDLHFADDLALLFHMHQHIQEKTRRLSEFGQQVGLRSSKRNTEFKTFNMNAPEPFSLDDTALPSTEIFTYLGSVVRQVALM